MFKCRICGWVGETSVITVREMMQNTRETFNYFECGNCHCLQIEEVPDNLGDYYGDTYYSFNPPTNNEGQAIKTDETRVLDVGCGAGAFLHGLANQGFVNLIGCDPFIANDIEYDNGIKIYKKSIHQMSGEYDWIYLNDSFEHVTDPHEVMESIKRLLAPKGIARIKLPIYPNIAFDMFGADWYQLDAPRHIFLHTRESIEHLAKVYGFIIVKIEYDSGVSQIVRSYLYSQDIPFWEQTDEVVHQHFTNEDLLDIEESCRMANQNQYGDHAVFYFMHRNN